ncbi:MAG TPA: hypothetical protein DIC51_03625 [Coxiellaceae bacterium]|nr:hypothetical protein [Coxiellaceae bacterium]
MRWFLKRPVHFLGLHLTDQSVYWVNLQSTETLPIIQHAGSIAIDEKSNLISAIKTALAPVTSAHLKTIISITTHKILTKSLSVSVTLSDLDILNSLKTKARYYFPEIAEPLCFEFRPLTHHEATPSERTIQVFTVKQQEITDRTQLSKSLGLNCIAIEPEHCALLRLAQRALGKEKTASAFIYLIIMKATSRLLCFHEQTLLLNQTVPTSQLTEQFASFLQQCRLLLATTPLSTIYLSPPQSTLWNNMLSPQDHSITPQLADPLSTFRFKNNRPILASPSTYTDEVREDSAVYTESIVKNRDFCAHPHTLYQEPFQIALGLALRGHDARP